MMRVVLLAILLAGCHKHEDPGPTCDQVTEHLLEVMGNTVHGHEMMTKDFRAQSVAQCEQRHLTKETRECMMAARSPAGLVDCYHRQPGVPPGPRPRATLPVPPSAPAAPAPAPAPATPGSAAK